MPFRDKGFLSFSLRVTNKMDTALLFEMSFRLKETNVIFIFALFVFVGHHRLWPTSGPGPLMKPQR